MPLLRALAGPDGVDQLVRPDAAERLAAAPAPERLALRLGGGRRPLTV